MKLTAGSGIKRRWWLIEPSRVEPSCDVVAEDNDGPVLVEIRCRIKFVSREEIETGKVCKEYCRRGSTASVSSYSDGESIE